MTGLRTLLVAIPLVVPAAGSAQTVLGVVLEEGTRTPVPSAEVALVTVERAAAARADTDSTGVFRLVAPTAGAFRLRVRHLAYAAFDSEPIELRRGETVSLEIRVATTRIALEPLVVRVRTTNERIAGFHERRLVHGFGRFLTREEIERRPGVTATDLLRSVPGVTVVPVQVRGRVRPGRNLIALRGVRGSCEPAIYIDGSRTAQLPESTIDDVLSPSALEGVEVYTSTVSAPAQYAEPGKCGVVLFWTRGAEGGSPWSWKRLLVGAGAVIAIVLVAR